jgi:ferric-dicitrate binding protein FerR (iron transport regulator)
MQKNLDWNKIAKYVSGNSSAEERKAMENKMESDKTVKKNVEQARMAWSLSVKKTGNWDSDTAWDNVHRRLDGMDEMEDIGKIGKSDVLNREKKRQGKRSVNYMIGVAAVVLISVAAGILLYQSDGNISSTPQQELKQKELVTKKGEQKRFRLSDGTYITLAADSKVRLSPQYHIDTREVYLEGEAFFNVASISDHPFKVHVGETTTEVLGTQFNIISYPQDQSVQVVVVEGSVGLRAKNTDEQLLLNPGELGSYTSDQKLKSKKVDVNTYTGWKNGQLIFEDQPLKEVVTRLERWYDLSFVIDDSAIEKRKLTATFARRQPLREVLDAIAISLDLTYAKHDSSVIFKQ